MNKDSEISDNLLLSHDNYLSWYNRILEESMFHYGIYELSTEGVEPNFEVDYPDYRVRAITIGDSYTSERNIRDGYIMDDSGCFMSVDDRAKNFRDKVYLLKLAEMSSKREMFESSIRVIKRIIIQTLSPEKKDMLQNEGTAYKNLMKGNDIIELIKLIKKCATGRGIFSVVIDVQRLMNMVR